MDFIKSWKFMAIIIGLFTLVVAILLVVAITTHTEPTFMAESPGFGMGDRPIRYCTTVYTADGSVTASDVDNAEREVVSAASTINGRLGFLVYAQAEPAGPCQVSVLIGAPTEHAAGLDPGGDAVFTNGERRCRITTRNSGTSEMTGLVIQHELGHCLGLAHDDYHSSIMCGGDACTLAPLPTGTYPPRISDDDREALRNRFLAAGAR